MRSKKNIVWIDLEMSGLEIEKHVILEVACIITDGNLMPIMKDEKKIRPLSFVIHYDEIEHINEWCIEQHTKSGLLEKVKKSKISLSEGEDMLLEYLKEYTLPQRSPLAGSSVHVDRMFLYKWMPRVYNYLHFRIIDVSSFTELFYRMDYDFEMPKRECSHRALDDIKDSIKLMKYIIEKSISKNT